MLKIVTWNINGIRARENQLMSFLIEENPSIIALQETKIDDSIFPHQIFRNLGYETHIHGQKANHGVAILSRIPNLKSSTTILADKDDRRHIALTLGSMTIHNFYVPAGGDKPDPNINEKFDHKLKFLDHMARMLTDSHRTQDKVMVLGDLNVAPLPTDVWNHEKLQKNVGHSPAEVMRFQNLLQSLNLIDGPRDFVAPDQPLYTWWGYRFPKAYELDYGWRLDHALYTPSVKNMVQSIKVCKTWRESEKASDHVPIILQLKDF